MDILTGTLCAVIRGGPSPELWRGWSLADWLRLVDSAHAHGVDGLFQRALASAGWPAEMPAAARAALQAHVYASTGHNLRVYAAIATVLRAVGDRVPLVVLKGAALGPSLYPAPSLRPLTDADLLAPPHAVDGVAATMRALGFHPKPIMAPELARAIDPHIVMLGGPGDAVCVEVHWSLLAGSADWRATPSDWFWEHTEPWQPPQAYLAAGGPPGGARQLSATATLLYQCAHLVLQHGPYSARLIWIYDLHLLVSGAVIDWPTLVAQAQRLGWGEVVCTALEEARTCFGTDLSAVPLHALRGTLDPRARFRGVEDLSPPSYDTWASLAELRLPTRLRLLARVIAPNPAYLRAQYEPRWGHWWPLAYPYRWLKPVRGAAAALRAGARGLRRNAG